MATTYDKASLVMIPSGYKDDKLYSVKPTDGSGDFTFSRDGSGASPATRVNASGLIEKGRENVLLQSNTFDTTWTLSNASVTSGQSGYDGSSDAWLLQCTTSSSLSYVNQNLTISSSVVTRSVYAKAGTTDWMALYSSGSQYAYFDLANGVLGSTSAGIIDSNIENIGSGWYRCSVTSVGYNNMAPFIASADGSVSVVTGDNIYIQDAQLEQGLVATAPAIETTTAAVSAGLLGDMPRLDYSGGATCPSLLLEPSRVNSLTHSEYLEGYGKLSSGTGSAPVLTTNYTTSIEGVQNATRIQFDRGAGGTSTDYSLLDFSGISLTGDITISFYAKTLSGGSANLLLYTGGFDTNDGDVLALTDEWQRFTISGANASGTISFLIGTRGGSTYFYEGGDQTLDVAVYGFQAESGSYPTSYIPTYGSASGRAGDYCEKSGITSLIGQTEGTFFIECEAPNVAPNPNGSLLSTANSVTNSVSVIYKSDNTFLYSIFHSGNQNLIQSSSTYSVGDRVKIAMTYSASEMKLFINGQSQGTNTNSISFNGALSQLVVLDMLSVYFGYPAANTTNQVLVFKSVLTDAECIALTTI